MYKEDDLYQVLLKYDFDLFRGNKGIAEYMEEHLNQYYSDIVEATEGNNPFLGEEFVKLLKENLELLKEICQEIPSILRMHENGLLKETYIKSEELFEKVKDYFIARISWREYTGCFYRIRQGDFTIKDVSESKKQKTEMFHIKKEKRNKIGAYRYSVAGYPCLYLASDRELAWFECGMPKKFSYCQMIIDEDGENALKLIDFSNRPVDFLSNVNVWLQNSRKRGDEDNTYRIILRYIVSYPLAAACSVKVKDRNSKFVEEYVFPQLFMQWIRKSDVVDGIRYKSSLNTDLVQGMGAINVALPVKKFREDGLDEKLTKSIIISDIGYLDVNDDFNKYKEGLKDIEDFKNNLRSYIIKVPYAGLYVGEMIELCDCVVKTYNAIMEGNYTNSELIFSHLNSLYDYTELMYKSCEIKISECKKDALPHLKQYIDEEKIKEHFEEFHNVMRKTLHKHTVFELGFKNLGNFENI